MKEPRIIEAQGNCDMQPRDAHATCDVRNMCRQTLVGINKETKKNKNKKSSNCTNISVDYSEGFGLCF